MDNATVYKAERTCFVRSLSNGRTLKPGALWDEAELGKVIGADSCVERGLLSIVLSASYEEIPEGTESDIGESDSDDNILSGIEFVNALGVLRGKAKAQLIEMGYSTSAAVIEAGVANLVKINGIGEATAAKIITFARKEIGAE